MIETTALDEYRSRIKTLSDDDLLNEFARQEYVWVDDDEFYPPDSAERRAICREVVLSRMDYERGVKKK